MIKTIARATEPEREIMAARMERGTRLSFDLNDPAILLAMRSTGLLKVIEGWLAAPNLTEKTVRFAGMLFDALKPEEAFLEKVLRPLIEREDRPAKARSEAIRIVSRHAFPWAIEPLLSSLKRSV